MKDKPKNIIICSDGTGNTAVKNRGTNVFKIFESIDLHGYKNNSHLPFQIGFYHDGVGTAGNPVYRFLGNAFGMGMANHVKQLYLELVRVYEPGDKIFLFGFSRGAFTVRTLAGFMLKQGILDSKSKEYGSHRELGKAVDALYEDYRKKYRAPLGIVWRRLKNVWPWRKKAPLDFLPREGLEIEFIGVWDTVDAYGFPFDFVADFWNTFIYRFKFDDRQLNPSVRKACHAIAIDDERHTFHPVLWNEKDEPANRIHQVWFSGVHSNVGGGYPKQGMSLVSLNWMMKKAETAGLCFLSGERDTYRNHANVQDKIYNSRAGAAIYYRYFPRDIHHLCEEAQVAVKIHHSVLERMAQGTEGYAPGNLPSSSQVETREGHCAPLPESIAAAYGGKTSPLDEVRFFIWVRRWSQWGLFLLTGAILLALLARNTSMFTNPPPKWELVKMALRLMFYSGYLSLCFLLPLLVVFFSSFFARERMQKNFSEFWYSLLPELRRHYFPALVSHDSAEGKRETGTKGGG